MIRQASDGVSSVGCVDIVGASTWCVVCWKTVRRPGTVPCLNTGLFVPDKQGSILCH